MRLLACMVCGSRFGFGVRGRVPFAGDTLFRFRV